MVQRHDVAVLVETRTKKLDRMMQYLPGYAVHNINFSDVHVGRKGHGIAVLTAPSCADHVHFLRLSEHLQSIWLLCDKCMFGFDEDVVLGASYINPQSNDFTAKDVENHFTHLFEDVLDALQVSPNLVLCGDFNAHVGVLSEVSDAHYNFVADCPEFLDARRCKCPNVNKAGRLLVDLAAASSMAITTGRVEGDYGQPSYVGYLKDRSSRPDHILLSPAVYKSMKGFDMIDNLASDHCGLSMLFKVGGRTGSMDAAPERDHVCKAGLCGNKLILRWSQEKALAFTEHIVNNVELLNQFQEAESAGDVDKLAFCVRSLIVQAASDRAVGMTSLAKCAFVRARKQKGPLSPVWFNEECRMKRKMFIEAVKRGEAKHACQFLRKESRRCNRATKRSYKRQQCAVFLDRLFKKDPQVHAMLRKRQTSHITPVATTAWNQHLQSHFRVQPTVVPQEGGHGCSTRTARLTCLSGRDMAVPLGRNHAPPEVLLRQGAESGWVPQPDCLETPSTTVLEGMVGSHIKKLNASASSGLDGIPIPFLKHACLPIERGRRVDHVNVLVPLIARMFRVFLSKARIPACWKVAKLSPLHKKGALSNPGNYRMIAVSGVMYRIYANVLKDLVTDWCIQKNKVPDTQFGFYPGRSTLHPLFILRHLRHAARKLKPRQSPRLHAAFIDFSQAYDTVPRLQLWDHLQRIAMPALLLQAIKEMYQDDEYI